MKSDLYEDEVSPVKEYENGISLREMASAVHRRRKAIGLAVLTSTLLFVLVAITYMLFAAPRKLTTMPFRLVFRGAEAGEYPNGTRFSPTEIISKPILLRVYKRNDLRNLLSYEDFESSVFILESNEALEKLAREYQAKMADRDLSAVERSTLETEFLNKKNSLNHDEFSLNLLTREGTRRIPSSVRQKILADILSVWADYTIHEKGIDLYNLSILSSGIFERNEVQTYDYVIALDMLRSKINRVLLNIDQLLDIPGARVIRTPNSNVSLAELRVRLEDTLNFKVQPLVGVVMNRGLSKEPDTSIKFLESRLTFNDLARQEAESRATTLRDTLATYVNEQRKPPVEVGKDSPRQILPTETVIPQISETFIDRIVDLTSKNDDTKFRQGLVDEMKAQSLAVVPLEAEANYYRTILKSLRDFQNRARPATPEEHARIQQQMNAAVNEAISITDQVNQIYAILSANMDPSTALYATKAPVTSVQRAVNPLRIALLGVLFVLMTFFGAMIGAILYEKAGFDIREGELPQNTTPRTRVDAAETRELPAV